MPLGVTKIQDDLKLLFVVISVSTVRYLVIHLDQPLKVGDSDCVHTNKEIFLACLASMGLERNSFFTCLNISILNRPKKNSNSTHFIQGFWSRPFTTGWLGNRVHV